jgi:hypothetical protein
MTESPRPRRDYAARSERVANLARISLALNPPHGYAIIFTLEWTGRSSHEQPRKT